MAEITQAGINSERIKNIQTFTQGGNFKLIGDESAKSLLALEDACRELVSTEQERRNLYGGAPLLKAPNMARTQAHSAATTDKQPAEDTASARSGANSTTSSKTSGFNAAASLIGSMATLRQLLHEGNIEELRGRLKMINTESAALRAQGEKLLSALESNINALQNATDHVAVTQQAWQGSKDTVVDLTQQQQQVSTQLVDTNQQLLQVQQALAQATADLNALPTPPQTLAEQAQYQLLTDMAAELAVKLNGLQTSHQQLSENFTTLEGKLTAANLNCTQFENTYKQVLAQSVVIAQQADNNRKEINNLIEDSARPPQIEGERFENSLALLTLLTAQLKKLLNDDSIKNMRQQQEVMETINEASRKDSEKKAKEAEEAQRKAEEASKAASCASKIFGYIMLAVSVVATAVSFGTAAPLTMAIAAIGLAMTVADIVLEETGNSSLMQMLAKEISTGITDMLMSFGVPEEKAKEIGSIMGMVLAAVAFLAVSLFSMSSFAKNMGQTVANVTKTVTKQVIKSAVKVLPRNFANVAGKLGSKATNLSKPLAKIADKADDLGKVTDKVSNMGKVADKASSTSKVTNVGLRKAELGLNGSNMALGVTNTAVSGGLNLHSATMTRDFKEMLAGMMLNTAAIQALDELLKALIKSMSKSYDQINEMFEGMITALNQSGHAKANMMKSNFA